MDYRDEAPELLRDFLQYHEVVKGHSQATIDEYYLDLRTFFRFLKQTDALSHVFRTAMNDLAFDVVLTQIRENLHRRCQ